MVQAEMAGKSVFERRAQMAYKRGYREDIVYTKKGEFSFEEYRAKNTKRVKSNGLSRDDSELIHLRSLVQKLQNQVKRLENENEELNEKLQQHSFFGGGGGGVRTPTMTITSKTVEQEILELCASPVEEFRGRGRLGGRNVCTYLSPYSSFIRSHNVYCPNIPSYPILSYLVLYYFTYTIISSPILSLLLSLM